MKAVIYTNRREDNILLLERDFPDIDWAVVWSPEAFDAEIGDATFCILSNRICTPELGTVLRRAGTKSLKWIHLHSAGIERAIAMGVPEGLPMTYSAGAKAPVCAEHAMMLLLAISRRIWEIREAQSAHYWRRRELNLTVRSLESETLALFGVGGIGREIARKAKAFDMRVIGVTRAARAGGDVDEVVPRARMADALARADAVIVATESDESSYRLVGGEAFRAMKPTAYLVNIARGEIVDQEALIEALRKGEIAGAALDVTDPDPLDPRSPLWDMDNVIITPHISGAGTNVGYRRLKALFEGELSRFRRGEPFQYRYDPDRAKKWAPLA